MKNLKRELIMSAVILLMHNFGTITVLAHEGYITTYNHHIYKGEFEVMLMNDFTSPSGPKRRNDGHENYFSQMLEIEYAPTSQLAFEFMAEAFEDIGTGDSRFTGFRYEARYRLFEEEVPLNPVLYVEYEDLHVATRYKMEVSGWVEPPFEEEEGDSDRESILESRLILSEDFGRWNVAFNWINESDLNAGEAAFGYSLGALYRLPQHSEEGHAHHTGNTKFMRPTTLAFELFGALGDTNKFDLRPSRQEHYFQPSVMFHVGENSMFSIGAGIGLTHASDNMIRLMYGWMF